jgi:hypothetical protein
MGRCKRVRLLENSGCQEYFVGPTIKCVLAPRIIQKNRPNSKFFASVIGSVNPTMPFAVATPFVGAVGPMPIPVNVTGD